MRLVAAPLANRSIIRIGGADRLGFLQALISNDVARATASAAVYAALLTPQGKFLHDLFVITHEDAFLVDCESARAEDLLRRLTAYKLRAKVTFENWRDGFAVWAVWGDSFKAPLAFADPRLPQLGYRMITRGDHALDDAQRVDFAAYDAHRLSLGVADGSRDMEIEKSTLAEGNVDFLNGIDWKKGCYIGQELTARLHYRGLAKKRFFPVRIDGSAPPPQSPLFFRSAEVGQMRSSCGDKGLAALPVELVQHSIQENVAFTWEKSRIFPAWPFWMPQKG